MRTSSIVSQAKLLEHRYFFTLAGQLPGGGAAHSTGTDYQVINVFQDKLPLIQQRLAPH
jgi:hypothetical protein